MEYADDPAIDGARSMEEGREWGYVGGGRGGEGGRGGGWLRCGWEAGGWGGGEGLQVEEKTQDTRCLHATPVPEH